VTAEAETDLHAMLPKLRAVQRPGRFAIVGPLSAGKLASAQLSELEAVVLEDEGWTAVARTELCEKIDWPVGLVFAWLTLDVHSSLSSVGLTAKVTAALAEIDVPANMIAAYHHDHILVPLPEAEKAIACIERLAEAHAGPASPPTIDDAVEDHEAGTVKDDASSTAEDDATSTVQDD
jgi:hypothetical protein